MSYAIRNQKTATSQRTAEIERLNYLALRSRLNEEYEKAQFERKENERLELEPPIPVYRSKDELMNDLTTQRQILKLQLQSVMDNDNITKFLGFTFKSPEYALLTNQYWSEIEPQIKEYKPVQADFLQEWLNRFFYTKQKMGTKIETIIDPDEYGDVYNINQRAVQFIAPDELSDEDLKKSVREIVKRNYDYMIDPNSSEKDEYIRKFYIKQGVIKPTDKLSINDWRTIYEKEIDGFDDRIASYLPASGFTYSGYKKGSVLPGVITPEEAAKFASTTTTGSLVPKKIKEGSERKNLPPQTPIKPKPTTTKTTQTKLIPIEGPETFESEFTSMFETQPALEGEQLVDAVEDIISGGVNDAKDFGVKYKRVYNDERPTRSILNKTLKNITNKYKIPSLLPSTATNDMILDRIQEITKEQKEITGTGYKFGKYFINKRGLKKKF